MHTWAIGVELCGDHTVASLTHIIIRDLFQEKGPLRIKVQFAVAAKGVKKKKKFNFSGSQSV